MKTRQLFISAAALAGASLLVAPNLRATAFANVKLTGVGYSLFDATPDDELGIGVKGPGYPSYTYTSVSIYRFAGDTNLIDGQVYDSRSGVPSNSALAVGDRSAQATADLADLESSARCPGVTSLMTSSVSAYASLSLGTFAIAPGTGISLFGTLSGLAGTDEAYASTSNSYEYASAYGSLNIYANDDGVSVSKSSTISLGVSPRWVWDSSTWMLRYEPYTKEIAARRFKVTFENESNVWQEVSLSAYTSISARSNIPRAPEPIDPSRVPDMMSTGLAMLGALVALKSLGRRA